MAVISWGGTVVIGVGGETPAVIVSAFGAFPPTGSVGSNPGVFGNDPSGGRFVSIGGVGVADEESGWLGMVGGDA
ncbi:MAG: hypothetical protein Q8M07_23665, partial [Prosthecobacter sp.]|nr:hypothetical protein [Prosthecobacter sp.]